MVFGLWQNKFMDNKEKYCKQLIKQWKDLIPRMPKVELGDSSPELYSNWEERRLVIRKWMKQEA